MRDKLVFEFAKKYDIPIMFVLAGGYQNINTLISLHTNTFIAANQIYFPDYAIKFYDNKW
jgi:acetoin utilization deacetylase AcuC-like enzyme